MSKEVAKKFTDKMTSCGKMNLIPLDEPSEPRCSNLNLPLFRCRDIEECLKNYLDDVSFQQWVALASDDITSDAVILLTNMCQALIRHISRSVFQIIEPQVSCCPHIHDPGHKESPPDRMNITPLLDGCGYCRVTEDDIQASLRKIFDNCFGRAMGVEQWRSCESDRLLTLFSVEIAKNVNSALSHITGSTSLQSDKCTSLPNLVGIVYNVVSILKVCAKSFTPSSVDSLSSSYISVELPDFEEDFDFTPDPVVTVRHRQTPAFVGKGNLDSKGRSHTFEITDVKNLDSKSSDSDEKCNLTPRKDTFLILCLSNLVTHVSEKTHTSAVKLNLQQIATHIREKIVGDLTSLKTVKNLHIIMYKDLCRKFGSKYVLQIVMEKGDVSFTAAVVETLKAELKKSGRSTYVLRMNKRNKSIAPVRENETQVSGSDQNVKNGSADSQEDRPSNCIIRAFSSFFSSLRRVCGCSVRSE